MKTEILYLGALLRTTGWRLSTAESCTGGMIAAAFTSIAGSSDWYDSGVVTYSNDSKRRALGVTQVSLDKFGAVSEQVVAEMAAGVVKETGTDIGISISGVAGPSGGSSEKPVGTVWIAWNLPDQRSIETQRFLFAGDRDSVRTQATQAAITGLVLRLKKLTADL